MLEKPLPVLKGCANYVFRYPLSNFMEVRTELMLTASKDFVIVVRVLVGSTSRFHSVSLV